ncbi:MAG: efflux RND transporter permease subunit [Bacteroidales bacterium]|nr:efflux RND transporter permease subunit [Bacteroidales bacterium]
MKWINLLIRFSLRNKLVVLVAAVALIIWGSYTGKQMDVDVFPDLTAPTVAIMTEAPGMAAEEVEQLVTFPIESAVNGAADVRRVRSSSMPGYSFVWVEFDWGTDIMRARQTVSEKMVTLSEQLPEAITPVLAPQQSVMGEILFVGLESTGETTASELRTLADWVIKPAILGTGGVAQVTIIGGDLKQYQVIADPLKMEAYGVTMRELKDVCATFSNNSSGGTVRDFNNEYMLRGMARTTDLNQLGASLVKMTPAGEPVTLADLAEVRTDAAMKMGYASLNAKPGIIISVSKQPGTNTLEVTEKIEQTLSALKPQLPADVKLDTGVFRQADFIQNSVDNVGRALLEGAVFVIVVLMLFLGSFRTTIISIVAIPLSLLGTILVLHLLGLSVNTMTLGGMCIAIGSLVDDAIIDVENVYKRLRQNRELPKEQRASTFHVVFEASKEIRASIMNATLIIIVAFVPLFFLSGLEGRMLKPLGIAYIISLFISLFVAMTVTPLLCRMLLGSEKYLAKKQDESRVNKWLSKHYQRILLWVLDHKRPVVISVTALFGASAALIFFMGRGFLPEFNEGAATISAVVQPGVSLDVNNEIGNLLEKELHKVPEVVHTARRTGRGELDEHSQATNSSEIDVNLDMSSGRSKDEVFEDMRKHMSNVPGVAVTIGQPLGHRIDHMISGTRAAIAIKIFGPDIARLFTLGNEVKSAIADVPGLVDVSVEQQTETPQIQVRANRAALARYGISIQEFNDFIELAFSGQKISDIYEGQRSYDVILRLDTIYNKDVSKIGTALIDTPDGKKVALEQVADIVSTGGAGSISRENVQRRIIVSGNVSGKDVESVVKDIQELIAANVKLPEGYSIVYGGQFETSRNATRTLLFATLVALLIIFLLLMGEMKSPRLAALVLCSLPLALTGGVMAIYITSGIISIPSIIGFITLIGVAVRNGILLISRYRQLTKDGANVREIIIKGSADRLSPILMTALTSALALIPLILAADRPGNEIQAPMAIVVLGGLLSSTLLNVFLLPALYEWQARKHRVLPASHSENSQSEE